MPSNFSRIISQDDSMKKEIDVQIKKAGLALGKLSNSVLNQHSICLSMKIKVYEAMVSLLSSTDAKWEYCTADTSWKWKVSTCRLYMLYLESHCMIKPLILKSWTMKTLLVLDQCSSRHTSDGLAMSSAWNNIALPDICTESLYVAANLRNGIKTQSKLIFIDARPNQRN